MIKYIFSGFKQALASKLARVYLIGTIVLILLANIAVICFRFIYGSNEGTFAYNVFEYASWCFLIPYYSCIFLAMMAFGKDYIKPKKHGTSVAIPKSNGIDEVEVLKPWQIYVAKLIVTCMLAVVFLVIAFVLLYAVTSLFHINEGVIEWPIVKLFLQKAALAIPLWFAGVSFAIMFLFMFPEKWKAFAGFAFVVFIIPQIIRIFSLDTFKYEFFRTIRRYTITQSFGLVPYPSYPERSVPLIVTIGIVYAVIAIAVGVSVYNKKASKG